MPTLSYLTVHYAVVYQQNLCLSAVTAVLFRIFNARLIIWDCFHVCSLCSDHFSRDEKSNETHIWVQERMSHLKMKAEVTWTWIIGYKHIFIWLDRYWCQPDTWRGFWRSVLYITSIIMEDPGGGIWVSPSSLIGDVVRVSRSVTWLVLVLALMKLWFSGEKHCPGNQYQC